MKANPGVTTIAAINGRGAYAGRSARSAMSGLRQNARVGHARRKLTEAEKRAFKARMTKARVARHFKGEAYTKSLKKNRSTSSAQRASSRKNIRKAQAARKAWGRKLPRGKRVRVGRASYGRKPKVRRLKAGTYIANRRKKAGSKTMARRRKRAATGSTKKRRSSKRRRKSTKSAAAPKRRRRRKSRKGAARRKTTARKTTRRRRARRSTKLKANRRRRVRKNPAKRRRSRRAASAAPKRRRRRSRKGAARRVTRKRRVSRKRRSPRRKLKANRRRRSPRRKHTSNRRRRSSSRRRSHKKNRSHKANRRRRHRRNGRRLFKMNGVGDVVKMGAVLFGGFAAHRLLTNLFANQVLGRLLPAPAAPAATSGFDLASNTGLIASLLVGAGGSFLASKVIKNPETKKLIIGGIVVSTIQGVVMSLLKAFVPSAADALSGPEDGRAARLSAMYGMRGLGAGASIMPRYGVINGVGEYFREPMNGLGEYFREPMSGGLGEYIDATSGLGTYEANGDLYQAAAGFGAQDYQGNHVDPSGDLDRQLTIAEAAAGVGAVSPFEAAAGIGPMQAAAGMRGFGAINTTPSGDTWIPGSVDPQLWAGVRAITNGQSATETTTAGVLQAEGGQGIFG